MPGTEDAVIEPTDAFERRPATADDVDAIAELIAACEEHDTGQAEVDRDDVEAGLGRAGFDLDRDTTLLIEDDTLVAWAEVYRNRAEADVRPSHRGRGLGASLLDWTERVARGHGEAKVSQTVTDANAGAAALLRSSGYEPTRTAWILGIDLEVGGTLPAEPPDGIEIRPYDPALDEQTVYRLIDDAFSEWEGREPIPFEEWAPYVIRHPSFSAAASPLAFDRDEPVGAVMSFDYASTDEGWIHQLATRATHRHRGIARALLHTAFQTFAEGGKRRCGLSTDSRTGALTLYERVGMSVRASYTRYTKPLA